MRYENALSACFAGLIDRDRDPTLLLSLPIPSKERWAKSCESVERACGEDPDDPWDCLAQYQFELHATGIFTPLLAQRDGVWKPSNPRKVTNWVNSAVEQSGSQLRRVWREMKGWRDHRFPSGGASSIGMMVMIEDGFEEVKGRDDLAMQLAAKAMRERILDDVPAPWDARENLNTLNPQERKQFAAALKELEDEIAYCVQGTLANAAIYLKRWQNQCGKYFSNSVTRVKEVSAHETVHAYKAAPVPFTSFRGDNRSA